MYAAKVPEKIREGWGALVPLLARPIAGARTSHDRDGSDSNPRDARTCFHRRHRSLLGQDPRGFASYTRPAFTGVFHVAKGRGKPSFFRDRPSLVGVLKNVQQLGLNTDNSWPKRLEQIYRTLLERDPAIPQLSDARWTADR